MNRRDFNKMMLAAVGGVMAGARTAKAHHLDDAVASKPADKSGNSCKGKNACKGKGGCKSGDNGCKGTVRRAA